MRSIASRLAAYDAATEAELDAAANELVGAQLPDDHQPTPTHMEVVNLLERLLDTAARAQAEGGTSDHPMLGTALRVVRKVRPEIVAAIAQAPEAEMKTFLATIAAEVHRAIGHKELVWWDGERLAWDAAGLAERGLELRSTTTPAP